MQTNSAEANRPDPAQTNRQEIPKSTFQKRRRETLSRQLPCMRRFSAIKFGLLAAGTPPRLLPATALPKHMQTEENLRRPSVPTKRFWPTLRKLLTPTIPTRSRRVNLAYGYAAAGDLQSVIERYEALLADPEPVVDSEEDPSLVLRDNLAYLYWQAGMPQKAVGIFRTLLSEGPGPSTLNTPALLARKNSSPGCVK